MICVQNPAALLHDQRCYGAFSRLRHNVKSVEEAGFSGQKQVIFNPENHKANARPITNHPIAKDIRFEHPVKKIFFEILLRLESRDRLLEVSNGHLHKTVTFFFNDRNQRGTPHLVHSRWMESR